jgi:hypothetical protein
MRICAHDRAQQPQHPDEADSAGDWFAGGSAAWARFTSALMHLELWRTRKRPLDTSNAIAVSLT